MVLTLAACLVATASHAVETLPPGASSCSGCHDPAGRAAEASPMPSIAELSAQDMEAALLAYRAGERGGTVMPRIAKGFSKEELAAIAAALGQSGKGAR